MGKFNSAFTFTGSVGNIHGYTRSTAPGVTFVGKNGGPSKEDFLTNPHMQLTRDNASEFSGASIGAKSIYIYTPFQIRKPLAGSYRQLIKYIIPLIHSDSIGLKGKRSILFYTPTGIFNSIVQNKNLSPLFFPNVISTVYQVTPSVTRESIYVQFPSGILPGDINPPAGATHFKIRSTFFCVSNIVYNPATKKYNPVTGSIFASITDSGFFDITVGSGGALIVNPSVGSYPTTDQCGIGIMWVEFYQLVSGNYEYIDHSADIILTAL